MTGKGERTKKIYELFNDPIISDKVKTRRKTTTQSKMERGHHAKSGRQKGDQLEKETRNR